MRSSNKLKSGFDPVTEADREAEKAIRARHPRPQYPDHGILGEEFGVENGSSRHIWVIDPIDGTRSFISGLPLWGTLVGLTVDGDAVAGMMAQPFTGELFYANASGAHYEGPGGSAASPPARRSRSTRRRFARRRRRCSSAAAAMPTIGWNPPSSCRATAPTATPTPWWPPAMSISSSRSACKSYDIVALIPIIEKAGGVVTTWEGGPAENGGEIVAAATPELHEAALKVLHEK